MVVARRSPRLLELAIGRMCTEHADRKVEKMASFKIQIGSGPSGNRWARGTYIDDDDVVAFDYSNLVRFRFGRSSLKRL